MKSLIFAERRYLHIYRMKIIISVMQTYSDAYICNFTQCKTVKHIYLVILHIKHKI